MAAKTEQERVFDDQVSTIERHLERLMDMCDHRFGFRSEITWTHVETLNKIRADLDNLIHFCDSTQE